MPNFRIVLRQSIKYCIDVEADDEESAREGAIEYLAQADRNGLDAVEVEAGDFQQSSSWIDPPNFKADIVWKDEDDAETA